MRAIADFAPRSPAFAADPYPVYERLRDEAPVHYYAPSNQWLVPRHADVDAMLRDRRLGRTYLHRYTHEEFGRTPSPAWHEPFSTLNDFGLLDLEPPAHTRVRRLVSSAFTPRRSEALRPAVRRVAERLAGDFAAKGGGDLIAEFAEPLPVEVIAELLAIPPADRHLLRPWSAAIVGMYEINPTDGAAERAVRASAEFSAYLRDLVAERRKRPGDDLVSGLIAAHDAEGRLSEQEMISTCALLLNAGHEATAHLTGNGWLALLHNRDQLELLRSRADAVPPEAVEELLRYDTPLHLFERWVLEDIELYGIRIPRGSELAMLLGSANRDPAVFADPDRLDLTRTVNPHVSFSSGIHFCFGAPLARIEIAESFGALLRAAPRLELAEEPVRRPNFVIRGLERLMLRV
ncbi:MAG: cytochrome P450 [Streptosporangiales bacterium]|nr:cytochrome P450 [Streptosporangiales bacterium]